MTDKLIHRGPDEEGFYIDENIALGHRRLSIIDLDNGKQPISNKKFVVIFNGEIYNYMELKAELIEKIINLKLIVIQKYYYMGMKNGEIIFLKN